MVCVCNRDNSCRKRYFITFKSFRITFSVKSFVVIFYNRYQISQCFIRRKHFFSTDSRVLFHYLPFVIIKFAGFFQDTFRNSDFADIVKHCSDFNSFNFRFRKINCTGKSLRISWNWGWVTFCVRIFCINCTGKWSYHFHQVVMVNYFFLVKLMNKFFFKVYTDLGMAFCKDSGKWF